MHKYKILLTGAFLNFGLFGCSLAKEVNSQPQEENQIIELNKGWNLKGTYLKNINITQFNNTTIKTIWIYGKNGWYVWSPNKKLQKIIQKYIKSKILAGTIKNIHAGQGFWINSLKKGTIVLTGIPDINNQLNLNKGWNLVSLKTKKPIKVSQTFGNSTFINTIWKWNNGKWAVYSPIPYIQKIITKYIQKNILLPLKELKPGEGFWIEALNIATININSKDILTPFPNSYIILYDKVLDKNYLFKIDKTGEVNINNIPKLENGTLIFLITPELIINKDLLWQIVVVLLSKEYKKTYKQGIGTLTAQDWNSLLYKGSVNSKIFKQLTFPKSLKMFNFDSWKDLIIFFDKNKDGYLTKDEVYTGVLEKLDKNNNGYLEYSELSDIIPKLQNYYIAVVIDDLQSKNLTPQQLKKIINFINQNTLWLLSGKSLKYVEIKIPKKDDYKFQIESPLANVIASKQDVNAKTCLLLTMVNKEGLYPLLIKGIPNNSYLDEYKVSFFDSLNKTFVEVSFDDLKNPFVLEAPLTKLTYTIKTQSVLGFPVSLNIGTKWNTDYSTKYIYTIPSTTKMMVETEYPLGIGKCVIWNNEPLVGNNINIDLAVFGNKAPKDVILFEDTNVRFYTLDNPLKKLILTSAELYIQKELTSFKGFIYYVSNFKKEVDFYQILNILSKVDIPNLKEKLKLFNVNIIPTEANIYTLTDINSKNIFDKINYVLSNKVFYTTSFEHNIYDFALMLPPIDLIGSSTYERLKADFEKVYAWFISHYNEKIKVDNLDLIINDINLDKIKLYNIDNNSIYEVSLIDTDNFPYIIISNYVGSKKTYRPVFVSEKNLCIRDVNGGGVTCIKTEETINFDWSQYYNSILNIFWNEKPYCIKLLEDNSIDIFYNGKWKKIGTYSISGNSLIAKFNLNAIYENSPTTKEIIWEPLEKIEDGNFLIKEIESGETNYHLVIPKNICIVDKINFGY